MTPRLLTSTLLTSLVWAFPSLASAQVWEDVSKETEFGKSLASPSSAAQDLAWARKIVTDTQSLKLILGQAPDEQHGRSNYTIDLPLPDGGVATFSVIKSSIMAPALQQKYPDIQTYRVTDTTNSHNTGRLDLTSHGFRAMFRYNEDLVFIDPTKEKNETFHSYFESDFKALETSEDALEAACGFKDEAAPQNITPLPKSSKTGFNPSSKITLGTNLRQYRLAVAATGEYTQFFGGTLEDGIAAVATAVNRLNVFYETDMAIRFQLVADNDDLIFLDPDTDGLTNDNKNMAIDEITDILNDTIGEANYDVGQVFGRGGGGVVGSLNLPCTDRKGQGFTGQATPNSVAFMNTLAHEIGHMFGSPHTFNGSTNACGSGQRSSVTNVEPHSGATFMSYHGLCGEENLLGGRGQFFHNTSLTVMNSFVEDPTRGGSCGTLIASGNQGPVIEAGADSTIPMMTPFTLTGTASDADGDSLLHIWEQVDSGTPNAEAADFADEGTRALFRSFLPNPSLSRTFPQIERVLAGDRVLGEVLPSTDRDLTFRMTTRDGFGGVMDDERIITVTTTAGPFTIETPASATLEAGVPHTVTWDVANTSDAPVSCSSVDLSLSTDGGNSFLETLATSTPNDGSEVVTFPNVTTSTGRLKASCTNQPFFAINDANFTMTPMIIVNAAPDAVDDSASVVEDSRRVPINVLANDSDPEDDTITLVSVTQPNQSGATEVSGSSVLYTPVIGFIGTETFSYTINDGNDNSASAIVTINVTAKPNTPPVLQDASITVAEDSSQTTIDVLANATDVDGDTLTLESLGTPSAGGAVSIENNQIAYTPAPEYSGTETVTYTVNDGEGGVTSANLTVTITPKPNVPPVAEDVTFAVDQDSNAALIDPLVNASDVDGDALVLTAVGTPDNGGSASIQDGQISYIPATGFSGTERFTFIVGDGEGGEATASVIVTVRVNTPQVVSQAVSSELNSSSGGGGAFGPLLLLLLTLRTAIKRRRQTS